MRPRPDELARALMVDARHPVVDRLTVAQQTGTSVATIERAYMPSIPAALQEKLAALKET